MNRRQFCRKMAVLGGALAMTPLVEACGQRTESELMPSTATPTSTRPGAPTATVPSSTSSSASTPTRVPADAPQPTATSTQAQPDPTAKPVPSATPATTLGAVALIMTTDRVAGTQRAIELLGINPVRGRQVLLKPNFNSADPYPGSTHEDTLRTLLAGLSDMGARDVMLADRSGMGDTRRVMQQKGIFELARAFGTEAVVLEDLPDDAWQVMNGDGYHWSRGFPVPKLLLGAERVVQTCNLKTHRYGGHFTLSLKNSVGLVAKNHGSYNYMSELHGTQHQRRMIAEINQAYEPALIVLDGVEAFTKGGPATGTKANTQVILAGTDRVAIDAVGVAILRLFGTTREVSRGRVFEQEQIARAAELGLGVDSPEQIRLLTGDAASQDYADRIREVLLA